MHAWIVMLTLFTLEALRLSLLAGAPGAGGKLDKLPVPTEITCTIAGDQLTVTWNAVERASTYRVALEAGADDEAMESIPAPPYVMALSDLTDVPTEPVTVKVRAMAKPFGGKGSSQPSAAMPCQAAAPAQLPTKP